MVKTIFNQSWLEYFRPTSTRTISVDIGPYIFRPTSTRIIFLLMSVNAFLVDVGQRCFWSILGKVIFWLRLSRVFSQCRSMIFFGRHQLEIFRLVSTKTIFLPMLVRVFVADIGKGFFGQCRTLIFFAQH